MVGITGIHVIFDASGSFAEPGKKDLLAYLGNTVMNAELMPWFQARLHLYAWRECIDELESAAEIPAHGTASTNALRQFLAHVQPEEAVLLVSDGLLDHAKDKALLQQTHEMALRLQVVAAGYDADESCLRKLTDNVWPTADFVTALRLLAEPLPADGSRGTA